MLPIIIVPLFIHMACAIICMGASTTFHLLKDHSHKMSSSLAKVDYAGISIMIAGSSTPPYYYSFFCEEMHCKPFKMTNTIEWRNLYIGLMYFLCFLTLCLFMIPGLQKPKFRPVRGSVFVLLGIMSGLPIIHLQFFMEQGYINSFDPYHLMLGGALYIIGAFLYMLKVPERFSPGTFDIVVRNFISILIVGRLSSTIPPTDCSSSPDSLLG